MDQAYQLLYDHTDYPGEYAILLLWMSPPLDENLSCPEQDTSGLRSGFLGHWKTIEEARAALPPGLRKVDESELRELDYDVGYVPLELWV